jgi:hypothetical protein
MMWLLDPERYVSFFLSFFFFFFETGSLYVAQADLKLRILPHQPPECWDYTYMPNFKNFLC